MGTENLHHKRKARLANNLERKKAKRKSYDTVLIICEDSKSSPTYLRCIIDNFKLNTANTANIIVKGNKDDSAPISIVNAAKKEKKKGDYDKVYCVIDRDKHSTFNEALKIAKEESNIEIIISIPCFEYWLLLYFEYTACPFPDCNAVVEKLKKHINDYGKSSKQIEKYFDDPSKEKLKIAIERAEKREKESANEPLENKNPYTQLHNLIKYLEDLKQNHL